jgi:hypothetical protein
MLSRAKRGTWFLPREAEAVVPAQTMVPRFARDDHYIGPKRWVRLGRSAFGLLDGEFCALEADAAVRAIAEWFVDRTSAAA